MKAKEALVDPDEMLETFEKLKRGTWSDPDLLRYTVGDSGDPAKNIIRPVGMFVTCRVHYVQDFIGDDDDAKPVPVCAGRNKCPICQASRYLYSVNTEASRERAKSISSSERNFWNVIPRWEYDWGDADPHCKVLSFGVTARKHLAQLVVDYGNPGDIEEGFDIVYEVEKKAKGGRGSDYKVYPVKKRVRRGGKITETVAQAPLDEDELEYDMVDLAKYTDHPSAKALQRLAEIFEVDVGSSKSQKRRGEVDDDEEEDEIIDEDVEDLDDDEDVIEEEEEDSDEEFLCFGDPKVYNVKKKLCVNCSYGEECGKEAKLAQIKARRKRG